MPELCKDLKLSIWREDDPDPKEKGRERVRIKLENELEMLEVEVCRQINVTTEKTQQSGRYFIREAVVIALRQAVSEAFKEGLISDSPGEWKITRPTPKGLPPTEYEIDLELQ